MKVTRTSILSGIKRTRDINVTPNQIDAYLIDGELIQNAFPHLSAGDREFIKTGITDEEWGQTFGEDE